MNPSSSRFVILALALVLPGVEHGTSRAGESAGPPAKPELEFRLVSTDDMPDPISPANRDRLDDVSRLTAVYAVGPLNLGDPDGFVILARYAVGGAGRQPVKIQAVPFGPPYRAMLLPDPRGRMRKYAIREVVFEWDGRDIAGNDVPSGTYPYTLRARLLDEGFGKPRFLAVAPPVAGEITVAND